jgi:hypothetical protein
MFNLIIEKSEFELSKKINGWVNCQNIIRQDEIRTGQSGNTRTAKK